MDILDCKLQSDILLVCQELKLAESLSDCLNEVKVVVSEGERARLKLR